MLDNAASSDGSISSFLGQSSNTASAFATISQTSITNASSLVAQIAATNQQKAAAQKLQDSLNQSTAQQQMVQPKSMLDPFIYFPDGSSIDTANNIMTMSDGTQYDTTTGAKYVDPASIQQLGNGAYLNTTTNIMTLADGTQINTVTGLTVSATV
jgi:PhoPQ-activated pathogenicity-related protein